ncbi:MAG: glycosyltransferase family 39 protein [Alphaproteobacteria bacterium]
MNLNPWWVKYARELILALMLATVYLGWHGSYGLFDVDEAVFTQATREMVVSGHYSMPTYNGIPRYQKPPMIYWVQAGFMKVLRADSLWAARLPSALFGLGSIALLYLAVLRFTRNRTWALWSAAALGLNLSFVVVSRAATADAVLNFFMLALVLWCLEVIYGKPKPYAWAVTGVLVACGLLAKGPVAGVPAALVVGAVWLARADKHEIWQRMAPLKVVAVAATCLMPWLGLLYHEGMLAGFFTQFVLDENLKRFGPGLSNTQGGNPLFYAGVLAVGFMPWVFVVPTAVAEARKNAWMKLQSPKLAVALPYLALVWACGVVGLFMVSGTKLAHYIVPAYPALAIMVGAWASQRRPKPMPYVVGWVAVQVGVLVAVVLAVPVLLPELREPVLRGLSIWIQVFTNLQWPPHDVMLWETLRQTVPLTPAAFSFAAVGLVGMLAAYAMPFRYKGEALAVSAAVFLIAVVAGVVPTVGGYTQGALAQLAQVVQAAPPDSRIIHLGVHKPSVLYLSQRSFTKLEKPLQLPTTVNDGEHVLVLTEQTDVAGIGTEMSRLARVEVLQCAGGYCLVGIERY